MSAARDDFVPFVEQILTFKKKIPNCRKRYGELKTWEEISASSGPRIVSIHPTNQKSANTASVTMTSKARICSIKETKSSLAADTDSSTNCQI